jgi:hypothetical protein
VLKWLRYRLDCQGVTVWFLAEARTFFSWGCSPLGCGAALRHWVNGCFVLVMLHVWWFRLMWNSWAVLYLCSSVWFIWLWLETSDEFCASHVALLHLKLPSGNFFFRFVVKTMRTFPISCVLDAHDAYQRRLVYWPSDMRWIAQCMELTSGHGPLDEQRWCMALPSAGCVLCGWLRGDGHLAVWPAIFLQRN